MRSLLALMVLCLALSVTVVAGGFGSAGTASGASSSGGHGTRLLVYATGGYGLALTDPNGQILRLISRARYGTWGVWSPNDAMIAWKDPNGVHVERADGSHLRLLVPTRDSNVTFIWSPDSRSLIVGAAGKKQNQLWLVPIDGRVRRVLVTASTAGVLPRPDFWTPGGDLIYDVVGTGPTYFGSAIRELSISTKRTRVLWSTKNYGTEAPIISPNLREWAYIRELDPYHQQLRVLDRTTGRSHLVSGINPTSLGAWSPNSRSLAVIETQKSHQGESSRRVVTIAPNGRVQHRIGPGQTILWGRGGELFILRGPYDQVWASRNGRPERPLFRLPGHNVISINSN